MRQGTAVGPEPSIAFSVVQSICDALRKHRALTREGLSRFHILPADEYDLDARVSLSGYLAFLDWLSDELERPFLGLELSEHGGPDMLGAVGYLFLSSTNLEVALKRLVRYGVAIQDWPSPSPRQLRVEADYVQLTYSVLNERNVDARQDAEFTLGLDWRLIQVFCGGHASLVQVDFEHDRPANSGSVYRRFFGVPVLFDRPVNALHMPRALLATQPRNVDPHLFPILDAHVRNTVSRRTRIAGFSDQVRDCLTPDLIRRGARADLVAGLLGVSVSTLQRRLRAEGTTFKRLVDESMMSLATAWMRQDHVSISAIAGRLGYAETACLTRAFRRWYGVTPRAFRENLAETGKKSGGRSNLQHHSN